MKKNIIVVMTAVLISLIVSEFILRLFVVEKYRLPDIPKKDWALVPERVWTEHHPVLGWYHERGKEAVLNVRGLNVGIHTNSDGFRGTREYAKKKPEGFHRLTVLGDSFTFGFGVGDHETFSALLEGRNPNLEVINLGVPGYGIDQILMAYRTIGKKFETDYVLVAVFEEQFWRATRSFADSGHAKPYFSLAGNGNLVLHNVPVPKPFELKTNQFPDLMERGAVEGVLMKSVLYRLTRKALLRLGINLGIVDPDMSDEWILGRCILQALIREIRRTGSTPVLMVIPPDRWVKEERKPSLEKSLARFAERERVPFLDLKPAFYKAVRRTKLADYYIVNDWHWTPLGHRFAADSIARFFNQQGFLSMINVSKEGS